MTCLGLRLTSERESGSEPTYRRFRADGLAEETEEVHQVISGRVVRELRMRARARPSSVCPRGARLTLEPVIHAKHRAVETNLFARPERHRPSYTIITQFGNVTTGAHTHPPVLLFTNVQVPPQPPTLTPSPDEILGLVVASNRQCRAPSARQEDCGGTQAVDGS